MQQRTRGRIEQGIVLLLGLLLTALVAGASHVDAVDDTSRDLAAHADRIAHAVVDQIGLGVVAAEATAGLVLSSEEVTGAEFTDFVRPLRSSERFPQLSAIALTIVIDAADTAAFEARITDMLDMPFRVLPGGAVGPDRWVLTFIEPLEGNTGALGVDLRGHPGSLEAATRALQEDRPTMTGPIELGEALGGEKGLAIMVPVVRGADDGGAGEHIGFTSAFFRGEDLLRTALGSRDDVAVSVRDRAAAAGEQVVGTFHPDGAAVDASDLRSEVDVDVFGRPWRITVTAVDGAGVPLAPTAVLAGSGLALTILLALLLGSVRSSEQRAHRLAAAATADLARANDDLARANADLAESNANLQRSNQELSRFAHVASHDLKQPVQLVISFTELLEDLLASRLGPDGLEPLERTALAKIEQGATRMRTLIDDFLAMADVDRGPDLLGRVEVAPAVEQVLGLLTPQIDRIGASVEVVDADPVIMDPRQLVPLLQNIIGNALKFHRPDVVPTVRISAVDHGRDWVLDITDNGIGIPPADRTEVFGAFRRLHPQSEQEGSGVGLAICAAVVEGHGGTISISDGIDGGCRFTVRLPQPPQPPRPGARTIASGDEQPQTGQRVAPAP